MFSELYTGCCRHVVGLMQLWGAKLSRRSRLSKTGSNCELGFVSGSKEVTTSACLCVSVCCASQGPRGSEDRSRDCCTDSEFDPAVLNLGLIFCDWPGLAAGWLPLIDEAPAEISRGVLGSRFEHE